MKRYNTLLLFGFMLLSMVCTAQDITDVEAKPYGSYTGGKIDTVDLATGNLMLNIPLVSYPQKGALPPLSFSVELNNAPYSQTGWSCDPSGQTFSSTSPNYQIECEAYSSRYDTSPPGAVFQVNHSGANGIVAQPVDETVWFTYTDCNAHLQEQTGTPCGFEDTWGAEYLPYALQNIGAYITSSYAGGIVTAQLENSGCGQNGTSCGAYQYSMVDPSGTTHELDSDASNAPSSWNLYHTADGSGYTFIPSNTPYSTPAGSENAYDAVAPADGWNYLDPNEDIDWLGIPSADGSVAASAVRLGTLYSPTGIMYSDTITPYAVSTSSPNYPYRNLMPFYTPRALYSVAQDPAGNRITRGPWYWSGYYSKGDPFADISNIYAGLPAPGSGYAPGPYYIDSVDRKIPDVIALSASNAGQPMLWKVPGPNNSQVTYTINYTLMGNTVNFVPGQLPGNPDPSTDINAEGWAINSITLPNNTQWGFSYSSSTADLTGIQIPTGGTVSYLYTTIPVPQPDYSPAGNVIATTRCNSVCHAVKSRTETDALGNTWTTNYSYGTYISQTGLLPLDICPSFQWGSVSTPFAYWTTETDPQGNDTVHSFCLLAPANASILANEYHEVLTQYYQGSAPGPQGFTSTTGTLLKTVSAQFEYQLGIATPFAPLQPGSVFSVPTVTTITGPNQALTTEVKKYSGDIGQPLFVVAKIACGAGNWGGPVANGCSQARSFGYPYPPLSLNVSYNSPVDEATYVAGEVNNPTYGLLEDATTTFEFQSPISQAYTNANMVVLPLSTTVSGAGQSGMTTYGYDENNGSPQGLPHGNLTSKTQSYSMGGVVKTQTVYNAQGMPTATIDANGNAPGGTPSQHTTTVTYDQATGLFPYEIQRPTTNGVQHIDYYAYDSNTGKLTSHTDENGAAAGDVNHTTTYTYDVMGRVTSIQYPDHGGSTFCYTDMGGSVPGCGTSPGTAPYSLYTSTAASLDPAAPKILTIHSYDGWGNQYRGQVLGDPAGATIVDSTHDWAGRVTSVSNPYRGTPVSLSSFNNPPCGNQYTCYTFDAFGRKTTQTQPDGTAQHWSYPDLLTTYFLDETGRQTWQTVDYLGRLNAASDAVQTAWYAYDVFNDLLSVSQGGMGQTLGQRSFAYDMPSRVNWSCNPEAILPGQTCAGGSAGSVGARYVYDANSNLIQKTDNRGIATIYGYDSLNRLLSKTYSDSTASSCFQYDSTSIPNGLGRLAIQWTQKGACSSSSSIQTKMTATSYDPMGRLLTEQRCMGIANCAGGGFAMSYSYDLAGKLASYSSGFGPSSVGPLTFSNTYDAVGRMLSLTNTTQGTTLFSSPTYTPAGAVSAANIGAAIGVIRTFDSRQRVTSETDWGVGNVGSVPGAASVAILGQEQKN